MHPWVEQSPPYLRRWIYEQGVDPASVERVVEGLRLSARGEVPEHSSGQQPNIYLPGLTARPWWPRDEFPWIDTVEAAYPDILGEFEAAGGLVSDRIVPRSSRRADRGRWSALYLYCVGQAQPRTLRTCPRTVQALTPVPGATGCGMCYFSIMDTGTHVTAHTGYTNAHLRCHLGLVIPPDCRIRVGPESRAWKEGKVLVFDDSFEHEVWSDGDSGRAVLLFDIWHPELTRAERRALSYLTGVWRKLLYRDFWIRELTTAGK